MKDCIALFSHLGILQTSSSSKPNIILRRNLVEGFRQHGDSEIALIIRFAYQRLPCTNQPSWNSSINIFFKPYILLSRNLMEGFGQHGDSEVAKIMPFAYERLPSTNQPFWNSSTIIFFQTIYPLNEKLDGRLRATKRLRNS